LFDNCVESVVSEIFQITGIYLIVVLGVK
jgi:hypothetical protein